MILSTKYRVVFLYTGALASVEFNFDSTLEVKQFLKNVANVTNIAIRVYKTDISLNTSTHTVTVFETELTEW